MGFGQFLSAIIPNTLMADLTVDPAKMMPWHLARIRVAQVVACNDVECSREGQAIRKQ